MAPEHAFETMAEYGEDQFRKDYKIVEVSLSIGDNDHTPESSNKANDDPWIDM